MKLDPQIYLNAAYGYFYELLMDKQAIECFDKWFPKSLYMTTDEFRTALLFMAHITEDENENKAS